MNRFLIFVLCLLLTPVAWAAGYGPLIIERSSIPGHWEGDLIKGARNASAVGTLVERTTLFVALARMDNATADAAVTGFGTVLNRIDAQRRLSLTYNQGRVQTRIQKMAQHERFSEMTGVNIYFADPHSPLWIHSGPTRCRCLATQHPAAQKPRLEVPCRIAYA